MVSMDSHSCESALHEVVSNCLKNMDDGLINAILLVDFKKAFDMVDQELLTYKMLNYGFDNNSIKLIQNYFTDRTQIRKSKTKAWCWSWQRNWSTFLHFIHK